MQFAAALVFFTHLGRAADITVYSNFDSWEGAISSAHPESTISFAFLSGSSSNGIQGLNDSGLVITTTASNSSTGNGYVSGSDWVDDVGVSTSTGKTYVQTTFSLPPYSYGIFGFWDVQPTGDGLAVLINTPTAAPVLSPDPSLSASYSGAWGFISDEPFTTVTFLTPDFGEVNFTAEFWLDQSATPIPELNTCWFAISGVLIVGALRRKLPTITRI